MLALYSENPSFTVVWRSLKQRKNTVHSQKLPPLLAQVSTEPELVVIPEVEPKHVVEVLARQLRLCIQRNVSGLLDGVTLHPLLAVDLVEAGNLAVAVTIRIASIVVVCFFLLYMYNPPLHQEISTILAMNLGPQCDQMAKLFVHFLLINIYEILPNSCKDNAYLYSIQS